jgi:LCP family protein required for cell wall assembly
MQSNYRYTYAPRSPKKDRGCLGRVFIVVLSLFACGLFTCGLSLITYIAFPPDPINILLMGVDARSGEGLVTRTDSIMLVGLKPQGFRASMLSIPRDLFFNTPGYGLQRVNIINVLGEQERAGYGPELLKESMALNFGVQVDHYVRLDFAAFEALIDAVGGVTIDVERRVEDHAYPTDDFGVETVIFEPGRQHMDGETALKYARTRHSDDDYFRADRQQQVLTAFTRKLLNPLHLPAVISALSRHVDTDLSPVDLLKIAPVVLINAGGFDRLVIDRDYIVAVEGGASPNFIQLDPWINERFK